MSELNQISDAEFGQEVLQHKGPVVVDFWAEWCGPCKALSPLLAEAANSVPEVKVVKLNIDDNLESPVTYGVRGIPTLVAFKDGQPVGSLVGLRGLDELKGWLESLKS